MEESNNCTFKFSALLSSDSYWGETSPENVFTDISSDEKWDTTSETITFLKELIEKYNNHTSSEELEKNEHCVEGTEIWKLAIHAREEVSKGFTKSYNQAKELLSCLEELAILLWVLVHFNDLSTCQELHDHAWSDNRWNTKLHQSTFVWGKNDTKPIQRISSFLLCNTIQRNLTTYQINEESDWCPDQFIVELLLKKLFRKQET